ncbi:hypothetical protein BDV96DRAFT_270302 [Lophiotrema nucula]|uniref:Uncharacterized protein n=1 Tax=Lophiotrema nucula TaxID=690887 RepID=A0A6A5ZQN7_9PLEO|nr:hypothetical protein BDV96DRAFT_270302 [Lophiotrema nucula]
MSDIDGDSTMHSSPEFIPEDDEMFPDEAAGPSTPRHNVTSALGSELSPPNSQGPTALSAPEQGSSTGGVLSPLGLNANGKRVRGGLLGGIGVGGAKEGGANVQHDPETGYSWTKQEEQPGWEWKNSRAREEEARALENIVGKGDQIKTRYGDPLDPSVPAKRG